MIEEDVARSLASDYLAAVVRSRRAVDRILACVADIAERDEGCARAIAAHPEALAALARCASAAPWLLAAAGARDSARTRVAAAGRSAASYRAPGRAPSRTPGARKRKR